MEFMEMIAGHIKENIKGRKLLIYGAWNRGIKLEKSLQEYGIFADGYIDQRMCVAEAAQFHGLPGFDSSVLEREKYYIVISLIEHDSVFALLAKNQYKEYSDFFYFGKLIKMIHCRQSYEDSMGNVVKGSLSLDSGSYLSMSLNSMLEIGENVKIGKNVTLEIKWNSRLRIGSGTRIDDNCSIIVDNESEVTLGKGCRVSNNNVIRALDQSNINIEDGSSIGHNAEISVSCGNKIHIGKQALLSYYIKMRSGNGHAIFDLDNKCVHPNNHSIEIGENVWICMGATLLGGAKIENHSIVGADSLVNREFPDHVILGGNPARIIRKNIDWNRRENITWEEYELYERGCE